MRNRPKLPAPKVGKDGCQLFDKSSGYKVPDPITAIMWVTASCNVKDALTSLQMELEGEQLQIQGKQAQKKTPGIKLSSMACLRASIRKESCKNSYTVLDLCDGNQFDPSQNIERREMPLSVFNEYYKQATAPKASTHTKGLKNSLNKKCEYMQNGCRVFHLEYNPSENN
jgi:hypothetical protein